MYILIAIFINLANPSEPAQLLHNRFDNKEQCEAAAKRGHSAIEQKIPNNSISVRSFCVHVDDLLELDRA